MVRALLLAVLLTAAEGSAAATALNAPRLTRRANEVVVHAAAGPVQVQEGEPIGPDGALETGAEGRAEVSYADRTLVRLGGATIAGLGGGRRELELRSGTLLLQVPSLRAGVKVRAGGFTVTAGRATALLAYLPEGSFKVVVLEGEVRIAVDGLLGDSIVLRPGKMLLTPLKVRLLPDPVDIDLAKLFRSSALVSGAAFGPAGVPLPSVRMIGAEIEKQSKLFGRKRLIQTNLEISGSGAQVMIMPPESE